MPLEPLPDDEIQREEDEWSPWIGIVRAVIWGIPAALLCASVTGVLAWYTPWLILNFWLRCALGFFLTAILFAVVHRAAGMASLFCTVLVVLLVLSVLLLSTTMTSFTSG